MFKAISAFSSVSDAASLPPLSTVEAAAVEELVEELVVALYAGSLCPVEAEDEVCACASSDWGGEEMWPCGDEVFMASTRGTIVGGELDT